MSFREIGLRIGAAANGLPNAHFDHVKQASDMCDVEHPSPEVREAATNMYRAFCDCLSGLVKLAHGPTPDFFILRELANQPIWVREYQDMAEHYAFNLVEGRQEFAAAELTKSAAAIGALVPAVTGRAIGATPTVIKGLLAAGIGTGAAAGGLYWALQRASTEDSDNKLATLQARIDEYNRMKTMLAQGSDEDFIQEEAAMQKELARIK